MKGKIGSLDWQYFNALMQLHHASVTSPRGMKTKEVLMHTFHITQRGNVVTLPGFETHTAYAEEELRWYRSGTQRIDFSPLIKKTWLLFSDDGETALSAYGFRIFNPCGGIGEDPEQRIPLSQWDFCIKELRNDHESRRAVIILHAPQDKYIGVKDIPCTLALQFLVRNNTLVMMTYMRSQDIVLGTRNDIYCFMALQEQMAKELGIEPGDYYHTCGSLHIYEKDWKKMEALIFNHGG